MPDLTTQLTIVGGFCCLAGIVLGLRMSPESFRRQRWVSVIALGVFTAAVLLGAAVAGGGVDSESEALRIGIFLTASLAWLVCMAGILAGLVGLCRTATRTSALALPWVSLLPVPVFALVVVVRLVGRLIV